MKKTLEPWDVRSSDFSRRGWHTRPTVAYQLMFEFLRLSPSYELARLHRTTGLSSEQKKALPADFSQVLKIYDRLGDVQTTLFRSWWLNRGLKAFGNPYSKPVVHEISALHAGKNITIEDVNQDLNLFLTDTRREEGLTESLLISVPIGGRRSDVLRQVNKLLEQHANTNVFKSKSSVEIIKLMGQRFHVKAVFNGMRLLWFKAAKPNWENWRLGAITKLSPSYSPVLDYKAPRRTFSSIELDDRIIMGKITSRALKRFEFMAENAARGNFPCDKPIECSPFNYSELEKRISKKNRWEKGEKARLTKLHEIKIKQLQAKNKSVI